MTLLIPLGVCGVAALPAADYFGDPDSAGDCVLQLPADDCGVSERRRIATRWRARTWAKARGCWRRRR